MTATDAAEVIGDNPMALYRLYAADDTLLYVGITHSLSIRFAEHAKDKPWWPEVARKTVAWHGSRPDALHAEAVAIRDENPAHNIVRPLRERVRRIDRHKSSPKAIRMPDGLDAWYRQRADAEGRTMNALLVAALEEYRDRHPDAATEPPETAPAA